MSGCEATFITAVDDGVPPAVLLTVRKAGRLQATPSQVCLLKTCTAMHIHGMGAVTPCNKG